MNVCHASYGRQVPTTGKSDMSNNADPVKPVFLTLGVLFFVL